MITPKEIENKAHSKYRTILQACIEDTPFSSITIPGNKKHSKTVSEFDKEISHLIALSKEKKGFGYTIEYKTVKTKTIGEQNVPCTIYFECLQDYLQFISKEKEYNDFQIAAKKIIKQFPQLKEWIIQKPLKVIDNLIQWDDLLKVCNYFIQNPQPNLYIRELPIPIHTKFIETNESILRELLDILIEHSVNKEEKSFEKRYHLKYREPLIRFKVLDPAISQKFFSGIDDLAIPTSHFTNLNLPISTVIIVENKTNLYTTLTLPRKEQTIAIFGEGYAVKNLKTAQWIKDKKLLYWGDIDAQGFEILSQLRSYFPQVKSIFMDKTTFNTYYEGATGTPSLIKAPLNLTLEEQNLYQQLKENNSRLEQEKIPVDYVNQIFR